MPAPLAGGPVAAPLPAAAPVLPPAPPRPPTPPPPAVPPPALLKPDGKLQERLPPEKIQNRFERQAAMIIQTAEDWAQKLAENLGDHPADYQQADPTTVHEMFHFSPYGMDAPAQFWKQYDELLQMATQAKDPDPYAVAERGALDAVYPYRSKIALLDALGPEQRVKRAEELLAIAHRQTAKGETPDSMAHIVGPAALPPAQSDGGKY